MTLRRKTLLIVGATNLMLIAVLYVHLRVIVLGGFAKLEEQAVNQKVGQALSALSDEIDSLDTMVFDWAAWDDTYIFVVDGNQDYVESNLVDETFTSPRLNLMLFADVSGKIVFGKAFDLDSEEEVPIPRDLQEHLSESPLLLRHSDTQSGKAGILLISESPLLVASRPILTSEEEGPIRGALIMGRYLDTQEVERLAEITHLSLSIYRTGDPRLPADVHLALDALSSETPVTVRPRSAQSIAGYALVEDIYGNPALVLRVESMRDIYAQGQTSILHFVLALLGISLVSTWVVVLFLEKSVLARLRRLSSDVSRVGPGHDPSTRVTVEGRDELADLSEAINGTLSALERVQRDLQASEKRYRVLFDSGVDLVLVCEVVGEQVPGKIIEANQVACQRLGRTREELLEFTPMDILTSESRRDFPALVQACLSGEPAFFEFAAVAKDGTEIPAEVGAHLFEFDERSVLLLLLRDVTSRKRAEEALRASERRFQDVARTTGDWIWETDAEGRYTYASPVVKQVLGYAPEEVLGKFYYDFSSPVSREKLKTRVQMFFRGRDLFVNFVSASLHRNGHEVLLETTGLPLMSADGQLLGYRGVHRDVTTEMEVDRSLSAIYTLGRGLVLSRDEQQIAATTVNAVRLLLHCHLCGLWLVDERRGEIANQACLFRGQAAAADSLPLEGDKSVIGAAIQLGETVYVRDVRRDSRYVDAGFGTRSELCVPLKVEDRVIGALNVESEQVGAFDQSERQILVALADQAALAIENAHLYAEMRAGRDRLRSLSRRLADVRENERRHIARELHDEIGQLLTGLKLVLQMGAGAGVGDDGDAAEEALSLVDELLRRVRGLTLSLRATMLDDLGLLPALRWHFENYTTQSGVRVAFKHVGLEDRRFDPEIEAAAYRIVQESLTNVARHAGVDEVTVRLWADRSILGVQIQDRGPGFDVDSILALSVSSGLAGMYERVELLEGALAIESALGSGTTITAEFPLEEVSTRPLGEGQIVEEDD
jgi:PAS domain S-box-containing protein